MMSGCECLKWIVLYRVWSTVERELLMLMESPKTAMVGSEGRVGSSGSNNGGHYS
jgi:hypothetical protein